MMKKVLCLCFSLLIVLCAGVTAANAISYGKASAESNFDEALLNAIKGDHTYEQTLNAAQQMQSDYTVLEEESESLIKTLEKYQNILFCEYTDKEIHKADILDEDVYNFANKRANAVKKYSAACNLTFKESYPYFKVQSIEKASGKVKLYVYEWTFIDYEQNKSRDICGYGFEHEITLDIKNGFYTVTDDNIKNDEFIKSDKAVNASSKMSGIEPVGDLSDVAPSPCEYVYNADKAVEYADSYALSYNPSYGDYNALGGDCANFVSQCLKAGGMVMTDGWYWRSYWDVSSSFISCTSQINYFKNFGTFIKDPLQTDIKKGNPVYYYSQDGVEHTAICVGENSAGVPVVNAHNSDRYRVNWTLGGESYWNGGFATIKLYNTSMRFESTDPNDYDLPERNIFYTEESITLGSDVAFVQSVLYQLDYVNSVSGAFDLNTKNAVESFQNDNGLEVNGSVDLQTRQKLMELWAQKAKLIIGDVDFDERITINDVTAIQKYRAGLIALKSNALICADADADGRISINDATRIQRYLAKIIDEL